MAQRKNWMISPRSVASAARVLSALCLTLLVQAALVRVTSAAEAPGSRPCLTAGVPNGYGTFLSLRSSLFGQTTAGTPTETSASQRFELVPPSAYGVSNVVVNGPSGFKALLAPAGDGLHSWSQEGSEATLARLVPSGAFNTSFQLVFKNGDSFIGFFPYTAISNAPPVPRLANFEAAQAVTASAAFTFSWDPWIAAGADDRIQFEVRNPAGLVLFAASSDCTATNAILQGATAVTVPAGVLPAGAALTGYLTFGAAETRGNDDGSLMALRGYRSRTTRFPVQTRTAGTSTGPGTISAPSIAGADLVFSLAGTPGAIYAIESTTGFSVWSKESEVTLPASGTTQVRLTLPKDGVPRFYRATPIGDSGSGPGTGTADAATLALKLIDTNAVELWISGTALGRYVVESSTNLVVWTELITVTLPSNPPKNTLTVRLPITQEARSAVFRVRSVAGTTPVPTAKKPGTLALVRDGTRFVLSLAGASPLTSYSLQEHSSDWTAGWRSSGFSITTDAAGFGSGTVPIPAVGASSLFYRTFVP